MSEFWKRFHDNYRRLYRLPTLKAVAEQKRMTMPNPQQMEQRMETDDELRVCNVGRMVYLDGGHLCAAKDAEAAFVIAYCLNNARSHANMPSYPYADADEKRVQEFFA